MKGLLLLALCGVALAAINPSEAPKESDIKTGTFGSTLSKTLQDLGKTKIKEHLSKEPIFFDRYFIECFPKEAKGSKGCAEWATAIAKADGPLFEQLKTMVKEGTDAVDGKVSAQNEVIVDKLAEDEYKRDEAAVAKKVLLELETLISNELPQFTAGRRWPADPGHKTPIAYCWDDQADWYTRLWFWWAMGIVRWNSNNLKFVKVDCAAGGHKIRLSAQNNRRCGAQGGGYRGGASPTSTTKAAAAAAATEQYIRCDFNAFGRYSGAHELIHALGFGHTQCRSDRDHYLDVAVPIDHQWRVIGNDVGTFDFDSVMLYPPSARGKAKANPKPGFVGTPANMGQRSSISAEDARIINQIYN